MKVLAVQIGNQNLQIGDKINTTTCYRSFMNYCIEKFPTDVLLAPPLNKYFKQSSVNPEFRKSIVYRRVEGRNFIFHSSYNSTSLKMKRMHYFADALGIHLRLHDDSGLFV